MCVQRPSSDADYTGHGWGASASARVRMCPYLGNGWTDFAEIRQVVRDPLVRLFTKVKEVSQLHVHTPFSYLGKGWTDCTEIWFVVRHELAWRFTKVNGGTGACAHVSTRFPYLGNGWTDCA